MIRNQHLYFHCISKNWRRVCRHAENRVNCLCQIQNSRFCRNRSKSTWRAINHTRGSCPVMISLKLVTNYKETYIYFKWLIMAHVSPRHYLWYISANAYVEFKRDDCTSYFLVGSCGGIDSMSCYHYEFACESLDHGIFQLGMLQNIAWMRRKLKKEWY